MNVTKMSSQPNKLNGFEKSSFNRLTLHHDNDEECIFKDIDCGNVCINLSEKAVLGDSTSPGSNKVKINPVSKYEWEHKIYYGKIVAVHKNHIFLAYSLKGRDGGMIRVMNKVTSQRLVLKQFEGNIQDLSFAYSDDIYLACCDSKGTVSIFYIFNGDDLVHTLDFELKMKLKANQPICMIYRVIWCPFLPDTDDNESSNDCSLLFFISHNNNGYIFNAMHSIKTENIIYDIDSNDLPKSIITKHTKPIADACFSPDGQAIATASKDGFVRFHQVSLFHKTEAKELHRFSPYGGEPVTMITFLEDYKNQTNEPFWKFALTLGGLQNNVISLWSCETWRPLQTLRFESITDSIYLVGQMDISSNFLILSDIWSRVLIVIDFKRLKIEVEDIILFNTVSEFLLMSPCLNMAVIDAYKKGYKHLSENLNVNDENNDDDDDDDDDNVCNKSHEKCISNEQAVFLNLFIVQPKALEELKIQYKKPQNVQKNDDFNTVELNSESPRQSLGDGAENRLSYHSSLSGSSQQQQPLLLTPRDLTSPKSDTPSSSLTHVTKIQPEFPPAPKLNDDQLKQCSSNSSAPSTPTSIEVKELMNDDNWEKSNVINKEAKGLVEKILRPNVNNLSDEEEYDDGDDQSENDDHNEITPQNDNDLAYSDGNEADDSSSCATYNKNNSSKSIIVSSEFMTELLNRFKKMEEQLIFNQRENLEENSKLQKQLQRLESATHSRFDKQSNTLEKKISSIASTEVKLEKLKIDKQLQHITDVLKPVISTTILNSFEPLQNRILTDFTRRISSTEKLFSDNLKQVINQENLADKIAQSFANSLMLPIQSCYKEAFNKFVVPGFEKTSQKLYDQFQETFTHGLIEYPKKFEQQLENERKRLEDSYEQMIKKTERTTVQLMKTELISFKTDFLKELKDIIKCEINSTMKEHVIEIHENVATALRSTASTPTPSTALNSSIERKRQIEQHLRNRNADSAFQEALCACNIDFVIMVCETFNPQTIFINSNLHKMQPVLLSLIQQLSADFTSKTKLKVDYIEQALGYIDPNLSLQHIPMVMKAVIESANKFISENPTNGQIPRIRILRMSAIYLSQQT